MLFQLKLIKLIRKRWLKEKLKKIKLQLNQSLNLKKVWLILIHPK